MDGAITLTSDRWLPPRPRAEIIADRGSPEFLLASPATARGVTTDQVFEDFSGVPWLGRHIASLHAMQSLSRNWHSSCENPPNRVAIQRAKAVLDAAAALDLEPSNVDPSVDEGVCIAFRRESRYADIECFNSGELLAAETSEDAPTEVWEVDASIGGIEGAIARISDFISRT